MPPLPPPLDAADAPPALDPAAAHAATLDACASSNVARFASLGWVAIAVHASIALVFLFAKPDAPGVSHAVLERWRQQIVLCHLGIGLFVGVLAAAVRFAPRALSAERRGLLLGGILVVAYLAFGAAAASVDQLVAPAVTPFVVVALAMAFIIHLPPAATLPIYGLGTAALVALLGRAGVSGAVVLSERMNALAFAGLAAALQVVLFRGLRGETIHQHVLAVQRERLEQAYARLQDLARQADEASRAKSQFLANVSHEFRTPMNSILGLCDLLAADVAGPRERAWVSSMKGSAVALLGVLEDVLDLSRVEAGRLSVEPVVCDLAQLARDVAVSFEPRLRAKSLRLELDLDAELPSRLLLDDLRVRQILVNLVGNAVKFTVRGGVTLRVRAARRPDERWDVELEVVDTGIGIPAEDHARIFDAFTQQSGQSNRAFGGTGLGLTITRRLVELMGGSIALTSEPGRGATFTVALPGVHGIGLPVLATDDDDVAPDTRPSELPSLLALAPPVRAALAAELGPLRLEVARTGSIDLVEELARRLGARAREVGSSELVQLGERLGEAASAFDVGAMDRNLLSFDRLLGIEGAPPPGGLS